MTHPNRQELADRLDLRRERLTLRPGKMATYCPIDAELDRQAAAALRQSPKVEEVAQAIRDHVFGERVGPGEGWVELREVEQAAQAIIQLFGRGE